MEDLQNDYIAKEAIFNKTHEIVGELTDLPSAVRQAHTATEFLNKQNLTHKELLSVFFSGAGFVTPKIARLNKKDLIARIVEECLLSFDISVED